MSKNFKIQGDDISDGYHTFGELYQHRAALFLALIKSTDYPCFVRTNHYEGWDAVYLQLPMGQISYHIPTSETIGIMDRVNVVDNGDEIWDGHESDDIISRLNDYVRRVKWP